MRALLFAAATGCAPAPQVLSIPAGTSYGEAIQAVAAGARTDRLVIEGAVHRFEIWTPPAAVVRAVADDPETFRAAFVDAAKLSLFKGTTQYPAMLSPASVVDALPLNAIVVVVANEGAPWQSVADFVESLEARKRCKVLLMAPVFGRAK